MRTTIAHEQVRECTREEVDRAIEVIERHLEKEARARNLLDEQATMRPKDLCKQQGLDLVTELRARITATACSRMQQEREGLLARPRRPAKGFANP